MHRWADLDDRQFPAPHPPRGHCAFARSTGAYMLQEGFNTDSVRQTKTLFVLDLFHAAYLFNFLCSRRGLPYLSLFIPANRLVAFCLQVTHPEVTFNSWTKKCVVMLYGTGSQPEEITNTVSGTDLHSGAAVELVGRHTAKPQHTQLH